MSKTCIFVVAYYTITSNSHETAEDVEGQKEHSNIG